MSERYCAPEESRLFNPAFMAASVVMLTRGYHRETGGTLPFPLAFVGCPMVTTTRFLRILPRTTRTSLTVWLQDNPDFMAQFPDLAISLVDSVRLGILFGIRRGALSVSSQGGITVVQLPNDLKKQLITSGSAELEEIIHKAEFVGRWLAKAGPVPTVLALCGVRP